MNVLSLFDGMSCGQIALERAGIKVDNYFSCEIKPHAIKVTQANYPETIQLGDITDIGIFEYNGQWWIEQKSTGKRMGIGHGIDLVIGGSPCFVAGTKIITKDGYKFIEDIKIGDEVLTHKNRFKKVISTGGDLKKTLKVKGQGFSEIETTDNHPFYVREKKNVWDKELKLMVNKFSEPIWKEAKDLSKGDFLGTPILNESYNKFNLTNEEAWIVGRYIADGHTIKHLKSGRDTRQWGVILSVGNDKLSEFDNIKENHFTSFPHTKSVHRVVFSNKRLVEIVEANCGCGAINKTISMDLMNLPIDKLESLLNGYMSGDGCFTQNKFKATTISKELIMSLSLVIGKVYRIGGTYNYVKRPKTTIIEGREVNQNDTYQITFNSESKFRGQSKVIDDIVWSPFRKLTNTEEYHQVYNLEVEDDNSYTANNVIVHNCQDFSQANKVRAGLEGEKSGLFYEFVRLLKEAQPKYFLLENVKMKKEWSDIISEELGVEPININSKLISAGMRNRYYWTNIPNVTVPAKIDVSMSDILTSGYTPKEKAYCLLESESRPQKTNWKRFRRWRKKGFVNIVFETPDLNLFKNRILNQTELERLQTVPEGYTKLLNRNDAACLLGDGWTVDVITHIFKNINK